jgi:hypothetical protein
MKHFIETKKAFLGESEWVDKFKDLVLTKEEGFLEELIFGEQTHFNKTFLTSREVEIMLSTIKWVEENKNLFEESVKITEETFDLEDELSLDEDDE